MLPLCGQIVCLQDTVHGEIYFAPAYHSLTLFRIIRASQVPPEAIRINHDMIHTHTFNTEDLDKILTSPVCDIAQSSSNYSHILLEMEDYTSECRIVVIEEARLLPTLPRCQQILTNRALPMCSATSRTDVVSKGNADPALPRCRVVHASRVWCTPLFATHSLPHDRFHA